MSTVNLTRRSEPRRYVYRIEVVYPPGAIQEVQPHPEEYPEFVIRRFDPNWAPPGWDPDEQYLRRFGTTRFIWPKVRGIYASRTAAAERAALLERYGAFTMIHRSKPLEWVESPSRAKAASRKEADR